MKCLQTFHAKLPLSNTVGEDGGCCSGPFLVESEGKVKKIIEFVCLLCFYYTDLFSLAF